MVLVQLTIIKINGVQCSCSIKDRVTQSKNIFTNGGHLFYKHLENILNLFLHFKKCPFGKYDFNGYLIFCLLVKSWEQYLNTCTYKNLVLNMHSMHLTYSTWIGTCRLCILYTWYVQIVHSTLIVHLMYLNKLYTWYSVHKLYTWHTVHKSTDLD